jgi:hypothetical protein
MTYIISDLFKIYIVFMFKGENGLHLPVVLVGIS